jgi:DNA polymerase-3 subunit beta
MSKPRSNPAVELQRALRAVKAGINARGTRGDVLRAVRLSPGQVRTYNYATTVDVTSPALDRLPEVAVDAIELAYTLNAVSLPDADLSLDPDTGALTITTPQITLPVAAVNPESLPPWPTYPKRMPLHILDPDEWANVMRCIIAAGRDDTLPTLTNVKIADTDGRLTAAATDRYRLAVADIAAEVVPDWSALLPVSTLIDWAAVTGKTQPSVELWGPAPTTERGAEAGRHRIWLRAFDVLGPGTSIEMSAIATDREFPRYMSLIPKETGYKARLDRSALAAVLSTMVDLKLVDSPVQLTMTDDRGLQLTLRDGGGQGQVRAQAHIDLDGSLPDIAFNPRFLLDGMTALAGATVTIAGKTHTQVAMLTGTNPAYRYLLMPVRLTA